MVDELSMALLGRLCPGIVYLEVTGMPITDNPNYQVLVNPLHPPVEETPTQEVTEIPVDG